MHGGVAELTKLSGNRRGALDLTFRRGPDRTYLGHQYASYPFHICRPHYYADDPSGMATLYIQSVAGGLFESDRLKVSIEAEAGAASHVTSQASTIIHGMERDHGEQSVTINAAKDSFVEYLPDCTILFPRARLASRLRVCAHETASVLVADAFLAHDPDGKGGMFDWMSSDLAIAGAEGKVLAQERFRVTGKQLARSLPGMNGPWIAQATVAIVQAGRPVDRLLDRIRQELDAVPDVYAGASRLPGDAGIGARIMAGDGHALRRAVLSVWSSARVDLGLPVPTVRRK